MLSDAENPVQLMHFSTKPSTCASKVAAGSFTKNGGSEYVLLTHDALELYSLDEIVGNTMIHRQPMKGTLLNIAAIPSDHVSNPDLLALTSESGYLTVLNFVSGENAGWRAVSNELIGKSGIRSTVPGEYLCVDPEGRCIFVAAPYKEKLIFRINRSLDEVSLGSPIEAKRSTCVFSSVAIACTGGSPVFATLESPLPGPNMSQNELGKRKYVCFYTYDKNLNQIRTVTVAVPPSSTFLAPCPSATPGVLVCTPFSIMWVTMENAKEYLEIPLPVRVDNRPEFGGALITSSSFYKSTPVFFLIQNEFGDIFRVRLEDKYAPIDYFGRTQAGAALVVLKGKYLLSVGETSDHELYLINRDKFPLSQLTSTVLLKKNDGTIEAPTYSTADNSNLSAEHIIQNTSPCYDMRLGSAVRGRMRYFSLTHSNQLHCTSYGLSTIHSNRLILSRQGADAFFLLRDPTPITREGGVLVEWHSVMVVSHRQETVAYQLRATSDNRLQEIPTTRLAFHSVSPTILAVTLEGGWFLQVTPGGLHAIRGERQGKSWLVAELGDPSLLIKLAAANKRQIVISFARSGAATIDFDAKSGSFRVRSVNLNLPHVTAVTIPPIRAASLATFVGISIEGTRDERKERFLTFTFDTLRPSSKPVDTISQGEAGVIRYSSACASYLSDNKLYVFLGTSAGQLICANIGLDGDIVSVDQTQLGNTVCKVISGDGFSFCYAQCEEVWRCSFEEGSHTRVPISLGFNPRLIERFEVPSGKEGLLSLTTDDELVPLTVNVKAGSLYTTQSVRLYGTGRKMERLTIESGAEALVVACRDGSGIGAKSLLQIQDTGLQYSSKPEELPQGESVISLATGVLAKLGTSPVIIVGISKGFSQCPKIQYGDSRVALYTLNGFNLVSQVSYSIPVPDLPSALHITPTGHVVVGMGQGHGVLVLDCGKTRLLNKHRLDDIDSRIVSIDSAQLESPYSSPAEARPSFLLVCGTSDKSICLVRYHNSKENQFLIRVATDTIPRCIIAVKFITNSSLVCTDRFGNVSFFAIPNSVLSDIPDHGLSDDTEAHRQSQSLRCTGQFHVGQLVNSIDVIDMPTRETSSQRFVVYSTILGRAGCFVPFIKEEDAVLAVIADPQIKSSVSSLINRTSYSHQSSFYPPCGVIDGDIWIQYLSSNPSQESKRSIFDGAKASDKRMNLLVSSTEVPRFDDLTVDNVVAQLKALISRTKPSSVF